MNKPYANDWVIVADGVEYSESKKIYWSNNRVYCELSARHNGIIGAGAYLRRVIANGRS